MHLMKTVQTEAIIAFACFLAVGFAGWTYMKDIREFPSKRADFLDAYNEGFSSLYSPEMEDIELYELSERSKKYAKAAVPSRWSAENFTNDDIRKYVFFVGLLVLVAAGIGGYFTWHIVIAIREFNAAKQAAVT